MPADPAAGERPPVRDRHRPLTLTGSDTSEHRRIVITCNDFRGLAEAGIGRYQQAAAPLEMHHLTTGHWPMFTAPQELADLLDSAAKA